MRIVMALLFATATAAFLGAGTAPAAPLSPAAICKAANSASMATKVHCRVVRKCGYFGCSYEEVCT
ncbi:MAG TPA: hypothetical protein VGZ49_09920 [Xanthobacteraceae bacterium]|jgi:hypothetical protein|nr:hypothetical protein [Xanthobacteraceae bacterium]